MKFFEGKSQREKLLVIGLIVALIFGSYLMLRVSNLQKEVVKQEKTYKVEKKRLAKLEKETSNVQPSSKLEKQVKKLQENLKSERENLQAFDFKFVDLSNEVALLGQIAQITEKAEINQLRILSRKNELKSLTSVMNSINVANNKNAGNVKNNSAALLTNKAAGDQLQRRMYRLKLRGTFKSTYDFIKDLQTLEYGVLITKLDMTADDKNTYNGLRLVITDITLAI